MVDLKAKPFYLTDAQIQWVEDTIAGMTLEEKLGQLLVVLQAQPGFQEKQVEGLLNQSTWAACAGRTAATSSRFTTS